MHFFQSVRVFNNSLEKVKIELLEFKCKICSKNLHARFGAIQNLSSHLLTHNEFITKWLKYTNDPKFEIDDNTLNVVKAIISANLPLSILENEHFARCLKMELVKNFRYSVLPRVSMLMMDAIDEKLSKAKAVFFVTDIWTNRVLADFLALGSLIVNQNVELIVLGMRPMDNDHASENIKVAIEEIVNNFKFNKSLAKGDLNSPYCYYAIKN